MTEYELKKAFDAQRPQLEAWGNFVTERILKSLRVLVGAGTLATYLKIPPVPRIKDTQSFLSKALKRKKYSNPLHDITDGVGVRFVVLLRSHIKVVEEAVESNEWEWSKDRDYAVEAATKPHHFDYQSVHYVLRSKRRFRIENVTVSPGIACEVQVRTLLQHAYAELAHDRIYKGADLIKPETLRSVAKGAALVEATDEVFTGVDEELGQCHAEVRRVFVATTKVYRKLIGIEPVEHFAFAREVLCCFSEQVAASTESKLRSFLSNRAFVAKKIAERAQINVLYSHSIVLFIYFLAHHYPDLVIRNWPFDLRHLEPIYADLGISMDSRL